MTSKNCIIFGIHGQDGYYLNDLLKAEGFEVTGIGRPDAIGGIDLASFTQVSELIRAIQPKFIFHLAANSTTRHEAIFENHETICTGTLNILESVRLFSLKTKVFISGSGLQFKNQGLPIDEDTLFEARDAYSVSRIHSVYAARYYRSLGVHAYVGYFFNHDSPRRSERHVSMKIAAAVVRISAGSDEKLEIGNTSVVKEWAFAGDIVRAVWLLVNQDEVFEAILGDGSGHSIAEWLEACFSLKGLRWQDHVSIKSGFNPEYEVLLSNPTLIKKLGWIPKVSFQDLAKMMVNGC